LPFLTLEDPNAKIKGSRDPLGVQPIWAAFGRHVVTNLTTQSTSVRGFTVLLLGRYFAADIVERGFTEAPAGYNASKSRSSVSSSPSESTNISPSSTHRSTTGFPTRAKTPSSFATR
jgi:hypothetical protein